MRAVRLPVLLLLLAAVAALGLSACGGGSSDARKLVKETFANAQKAKSGKIDVRLDLGLTGLKGVNGPVSLRFTGPFDRTDPKGVPKFAFTLSGTVNGKSLSAGATSTGTSAFISVQNQPYVLDAKSTARFRQSFGQVTNLSQAPSSSGELPWFTDPENVGEESIGGVQTEHVTGKVDVGKLFDQINARRRAGAPPLDARTRASVANRVTNPRFEFWTGKDDKVLRRLRLAFSVDVPSAQQARLGGLRTVTVSGDYTITDLDRPQTISTPRGAKSQAELQKAILPYIAVISQLVRGAQGVTGGTPAPGTGGGAGSGSRYDQCVQAAGNDIPAAQRCASLLGQ